MFSISFMSRILFFGFAFVDLCVIEDLHGCVAHRTPVIAEAVPLILPLMATDAAVVFSISRHQRFLTRYCSSMSFPLKRKGCCSDGPFAKTTTSSGPMSLMARWSQILWMIAGLPKTRRALRYRSSLNPT